MGQDPRSQLPPDPSLMEGDTIAPPDQPVAPPEIPSAPPPPSPLAALLPNLAPVLGPPPQLPVPALPPLPAPVQQDPKQKILTLAALGMMIGMGPKGGIGAAQGLQAAEAQMNAEQMRQFNYQLAVQQHQQAQVAAQQHQLEQQYAQREAALQRVLLQFNGELKTVTTQDDYDRLIQNYSAALQQGGYRITPDWFRQNFKYTTPTAEATLQKAVDKITTSEPYRKMTAENPEAWKTFTVQVAVDPKHPEVKTPFTLPQAYAKLGIEFGGADAQGTPAFVPLGKGTEEQNYLIEAKGAFQAQFNRPPKTAADNTWIMDRIATRKAAAAELKRPEKDPLAQELARQRLQDLKDKKTAEASSVADIGEQLFNGDLVPSMLSKRTGNYNEALAEANRISKERTGKPYSAVQAQIQYEGAKRFVQSLNGTQQVRFKGLGVSVVNTIDEVKRLSEQMDLSGFAAMNRIQLDATLKLEGNSEKGQLIAAYLGATNTLKEEFANLVNGGMAPTEPAFALANKQINENYGVKAMGSSLTEVQRLIKFRLGAFNDLTPSYGGVGGGSTPTPDAPPTLIFDPATKTFTRPRGQP